jgi:hypothetical protein
LRLLRILRFRLRSRAWAHKVLRRNNAAPSRQRHDGQSGHATSAARGIEDQIIDGAGSVRRGGAIFAMSAQSPPAKYSTVPEEALLHTHSEAVSVIETTKVGTLRPGRMWRSAGARTVAVAVVTASRSCRCSVHDREGSSVTGHWKSFMIMVQLADLPVASRMRSESRSMVTSVLPALPNSCW